MWKALPLVALLGCGGKGAPPPGPLSVVAPVEAGAWYARARLAEQRGDAAEAARAMAWVVRLDGSSAHAWLALGTYEARAGRPDAATRALRTSLELDPELAEARTALARVLAVRDREAALAVLAEGDPDPEGWELAARLHLAEDRPLEAGVAVASWRAACDAAACPGAAVRRGGLALQVGDAPGAVLDARAALDDRSEDLEAADLLVRAADAACRSDEAVRWFADRRAEGWGAAWAALAARAAEGCAE